MRYRQRANVVGNNGLVGEVRSELRAAGNLVHIFEGREDDVTYAGLDRCICQLFAEHELGIILRQELRRHKICAVGSLERRHEILLMAEAKRRDNDFCTEVR
ncbi:hypothetical protein D3C71_1715970 [compost metagenome]